MAYTKFVLISHLRSGTHLLRTLLESHPALVCQSELFNSDDPNLPYSLSISSQEILDRWAYCDFDPTVQCAGFVLQAYHPMGLRAFPGIRENPGWQNVWTLLEAMPELKVIHLRRENHLRRHLSHVMARQSGNWHQWDEEKMYSVSHLHPPVEHHSPAGEKLPIVLEADRLRLDFEDVELMHARVTHRFQDRAYFALSYESLCTNTGHLGNKLLEFLGLSRQPLQAAVRKLEHRPLADCIVNYRELKQNFSATPWCSLFDEDPVV